MRTTRADWQVINQGENGRAIPRRDWEIAAAVETIYRWEPDVVKIMLGNNDLLQLPNLSTADCTRRMEQFLYALLPQCPPRKVLLIAPPPMTLGAWVGDSQIVDTSRCLAEFYKAAAHRLGICFADAETWKIGLAFDGVHFSEAGHLAFAKEIDQTLRHIAAKADEEAVNMLMNSGEYLKTIAQIKQEIKAVQYRAAVHVNTDMVLLYYGIGRIINEHKAWGNKFIDNLATDIRLEFPDSKGYSVRNLKYMAKFADAYPEMEFVQTVSAQIPWSHNIAILDKVKDLEQRVWYINKTAENGWSHVV